MRNAFLTLPAIAMLATAFPAVAEDAVETIGGWTITTSPRPDAAIDPVCILTSPAGKNVIQFRLDNSVPGASSEASRGGARLHLIVPDSLADKTSAKLAGVTIEIPGERTWDAVEMDWRKRKSAGTATVVLEPRIDAVVRPLARGAALEADIPLPSRETKSYSIPLKGSYSALVAYERCLAKVKWVPAKSGAV